MLELDKDGRKIDAIKRDFWAIGVEICCMQALLHWLRGNGVSPVNWKTLLKCLCDMECGEIAENIEKELSQVQSTPEDDVIDGDSPSIDLESLSILCDSDSSNEVNTPSQVAASRYSLYPKVKESLREYQWELALPGISGQNYIVCAPTGTGKTLVAGLIISEHLKRLKGRGRVVFIVNKVPLASQQKDAMLKMMQGVKVEEITGDMAQYKKAVLSMGTASPHQSPQPASRGAGHCSTVVNASNGATGMKSDTNIIVCTAGCLLNELKNKRVCISDITLLIIDECHHTRKNDNYAKIMEIYLREKEAREKDPLSGRDLPQVIGLTATPGAGDSARPTISTILDHLITLCAHMDAYGGIQMVTKNAAELTRYQNRAVCTTAVSEGRDSSEEVISIITRVMEQLEGIFEGIWQPPACEKWQQPYNSWSSTTIHKYEGKAISKRDHISTLEILKCLSSMLSVYLDLRLEDALSVLEDFTMLPSTSASPLEKQLETVLSKLKIKLASLPEIENPLLKKLEEILIKTFSQNPDSKAIIFVQTKKHATSVCKWVSATSSLNKIKPNVVTGQTRATGLVMSKADQDHALKGFRENDFNLLVTTSVLEEGIDVPACNLVVRYQKVTSEVAQVQTQGRARAESSQTFSIISSSTKKQYQELLNEEKILLVEESLKMLPSGDLLQRKLTPKQKEILRRVDSDLELATKLKAQHSPYEIVLLCKKCKAFACNGSFIRTIPKTLHYVVTDPEFDLRIRIISHHTPTNEPHGLSRTHKVHCVSCDQSWGARGRWWQDAGVFSVLKCSNFIFQVKGETFSIKKWKDVPFEVLPMS